MDKHKKVLLIAMAVLIYFVQACNTMESELSIGDAIEGDYTVGYMTSLPDNPTDIDIGSLSLADGNYTFTQLDGVDIPENMVDRFFFIENVEGQYEVIYDYAYQPSQNILDLVEGEFVARIYFSEENSKTNSGFDNNQVFLMRYSEKSNTLYFHSVVSELEFWYVGKDLK